MRLGKRSLLIGAGVSLGAGALPAACIVETTDGGPQKDPGALVHVTMAGQVGVLLDEIPTSIRERVASALLQADEATWKARAERQLTLTSYRLNFRPFFYDPSDAKKQLPLPPPAAFQITLRAANGAVARRDTVDGHDYVLVDYDLGTTLLTDVDSPGASEPALGAVGGTWSEPFVLPVDPELLIQRTGFACMDEAEFPPNSVDSEDIEFFYDQECTVEPELSPDGCHGTVLANEDCEEALIAHVGRLSTTLVFTRVPWDAAQADAVRSGVVTNPNGADLQVVTDELAVNRITYRYIAPDSCSIAEQCVGGPGWRRLLQFNASAMNLGATALNLGEVDYFVDHPDAGSENTDHHIFEFSACHHHYHFSHYGTFAYGALSGGKRAFCLESVQRYSNNETSPTHNPYNDCAYQGIAPGWGDQYNAGIECQWIDITTVDTSLAPTTQPLEFDSNPDGFLCEGTPVLDAAGQIVWEGTQFKTTDGQTVDRPKCDFMAAWDQNNVGQSSVTVPVDGEGLVTASCDRGQIGSKRNCGYHYDGAVRTCTPGQPVTLSCTLPANAEPHAVRVCEASMVLGSGLACLEGDALGAGELDATAAGTVTFTCPAARDANEPGGLFALYTGPVVPDDAASTVSCTIQ